MYQSDRSLLLACRNGDSQAWLDLVSKYERLIFSIARKHSLSPEDAADVTQITFSYFIQSLDSLSDDSNLGAWLATVARRHSWRIAKRQRKKEGMELDENLAKIVFAGRSIEGSIEQWELTEWIHDALLQMDDRCRELLIALYLDPKEPSYEEIARELNIAVGSVGPIRARCLERLRRVLQP